MKVIIFKQDSGALAVIYPTQEALDLMGLEAIAAKDVPTGKPYKIVDISMVPTDQEAREKWTIDETELTDGVGA